MEVNNNIEKTKTIVLVDSVDDFQKYSKIIENSEFEIITFDYKLHKILQLKRINHKISDEFIVEEINDIQELTRKFSYWYKELEILDYINYENVNLGRLFYPELHYFLVPFLKKFCEVYRICQKYKNCKYLTSTNLFELTRLFSSSVENLSPEKKPSTNYLYDSLKIPVKIGNNSYSISLPKTLFKKFKNISEKFIKLFLNKKYTIPSESSTLLVEFDTIRYKKLFEASNNQKINLVHYGRRRPTIWNKESFNIIKNSNCLLVDTNKIFDKNLKNSIYQGELLVNENLTKLLKKHKFFENFFSFHQHSLWSILKPFFVDLVSKRFSEAILEIEITKKIFKSYKFKNILILSEHGFNEQIIIQLAKQQNIPLNLLQHGVFFDTPEAFEQNIFAGILPMDSNFFLTWGNSTKNYSIKSGISAEKLKPLGSILYDKIFQNKQKNLHLKSDYILFALAWPGKNQVNDLTVETLESYEKSIKEICTIISVQKKKLIIKIHPYSEQEDLTTMIKKINSEITIIKNGDILDLIQSCELFITLDLSTTILEAQILEKPVISIIVRNTGLGNPSIFKDNSCIRIPIECLETELLQLSNNEYRKNIVQKGNDFVKEYILNSNTSPKILSYLQKS